MQKSAIIFHARIARDAVNVYRVISPADRADNGYALQKFHIQKLAGQALSRYADLCFHRLRVGLCPVLDEIIHPLIGCLELIPLAQSRAYHEQNEIFFIHFIIIVAIAERYLVNAF